MSEKIPATNPVTHLASLRTRGAAKQTPEPLFKTPLFDEPLADATPGTLPNPVRFALQPYTTNTGSKTAGHKRNFRYDPAGKLCQIASPQSERPILILCVFRCVRRSWLCGWDSYLAKSFEHRKPWVERRVAELAEIFANSILSYAVTSNHFHLVVSILLAEANAWCAQQIA